MANLDAQPEWPPVRQLETDELARGGINGNMNEQAKSLVARTEFLKEKYLDSRSIFDFLAGANLTAWKADKKTYDWTPIFQIAELYSRTYGGVEIRLPKRGSPYLLKGIAGADGVLNGLLFKNVGATNWRASTPAVQFVGDNQNIKLVAGSDNMHIVRLSSSFCTLKNVFLDTGDKVGVNALSLIPENTLSPHAESQQSYNLIENVSMWGTAEGIVMQCGGNGGCYYNEFYKITYHGGNKNGTRALYLKEGIPVAGSTYASCVNRNKFFGFAASNCNTGFEIKSGDTNTFMGLSAELVNRGTLPNATPTALKVHEYDGGPNNWYNQANCFYNFVAETCSRDLEILNPNTHFFGARAEASKSIVHPKFHEHGTFISTIGHSTFPAIWGGFAYRLSEQPAGMDINWGINVNDRIFDAGYRNANYQLTTSNVSNVSLIRGMRSVFTRLARTIEWHFRFNFTAVGATSPIEINVPEKMKPIIDLYCTFDTTPQFTWNIVRINQSGSRLNHIAYFNSAGTKLIIPAPSGGWSTFTDNTYDGVDVSLRYFM